MKAHLLTCILLYESIQKITETTTNPGLYNFICVWIFPMPAVKFAKEQSTVLQLKLIFEKFTSLFYLASDLS